MYEVELGSDRRADPGLQQYMRTISRYELLTRDEEFELARSLRAGVAGALDRLVNANLRFVVYVAKRYLNRGLGFMDLIAEGNTGLITAARRFDERRGFRFISYAVWWIRQAIQKAIAEQTNTVRLPLNRAQQAQRMKHIARGLEQRLQRPASPAELGAAMELSAEKLREIQAASRPLLSFNAHPYDDDWSLADSLADGNAPSPEERFLDDELRVELDSALGVLSDRERGVVVRYYGLGDRQPATLGTIGRGLSLSRERVRQIRNEALTKLRATGAAELLLAYLS
jgi:RNA polymerase primary sigma factor